ncbi:hypothetical protein MPSEU_000518300 [Mayamaea pseudoterrestris]|nr:hypothetical protein MPSEU_000518300 [Mayamaea pseudoterrestris]
MTTSSKSSKSKENIDSSRVAMVWDPKNPYVLKYVDNQFRRQEKSSNGHSLPVLKQTPALNGIGCSDPELAALGAMIDATEHFYQDKDQQLIGSTEACQQLSLQYRRALRSCLADIVATLTENQQVNMDLDADNEDYQVNMELLKATYLVLHISDIFLPLIPRSLSSLTRLDTNLAWNQPGRITANFVRYLRIQHYSSPNASPLFHEIQGAHQPEGYGRRYWELVEGFIISGSLTQAWDLLQRHSLYQLGLHMQSKQEARGADENMNSEEYFLAKRAMEMVHAMETIQEIMSRAPLPGGRNSETDDSVTLGYPEEVLDDMDVYADDFAVQPSDYNKWELRASSLNMSAMYGLQHQTVMDKYRTWQDFVKETRRTLPPGRLPELTRILSLLSGDFSEYTFTHWSEALLADLLYRKPDMRPRDLVKRARKFIRLHSPELKPNLEPIMSIMEGNAAKAIYLLQTYGGRSGAALPATTTALIYNLFMESDILRPENMVHLTNHLYEAAEAIVASMQDTHVGVTFATRLLLPFVLHDGNRVLLANICEMLGHYFPQTDQDAITLINLCRPLLEKKSTGALDACSDLVLARHRCHINSIDYSNATNWIVKGIALEYQLERPGSCCRTLASQSLQMAEALIKAAAEKNLSGNGITEDYLSAKQVMLVLAETSSTLYAIPETELLVSAVSIYEAIHHGAEGRSTVAKEVIRALQSVSDRLTYIRTNISAPRMHVWLLQIAGNLLEMEIGLGSATVSTFGKEDLSVLSERLQVLNTMPSTQLPNVDVAHLDKLFLNALGWTEMKVNNQLKERRTFSWDGAKYGHIHSIDLGSYPKDKQEVVVRMMLDD